MSDDAATQPNVADGLLAGKVISDHRRQRRYRRRGRGASSLARARP